jgi:cystathionine gamma-synthase
MSKNEKQHIETIAIHAGMSSTSKAKSVVPPVEVSTIFEHDEGGHKEGDYLYSRMNNPNREALEQLLARLEDGEQALAFSSGLAAMSALYQWAGKGAHIIIPEDVYHGSWKLMAEFAESWSIEFDMVDTSDLEKVEAAIRPETKLIHLETPSNPLLIITDIEKAVVLARKHGITLSFYNTWPTPYNLKPLTYGADLVIHSTTKYLGGHSDIIGGAIVFREVNERFERIKKIQVVQGGVPSPRDCWLLSRSIRSFPYRMRGHNANAAEVAKVLVEHPAVDKVYYPGLESHPGHQIAAAQMKGFGGMISFIIKGGAKEALKVVASSKLISRATSLGGVESLWEHRASSEGEHSPTPQNLIRISVGLEHPDDLCADIKQALDQIL